MRPISPEPARLDRLHVDPVCWLLVAYGTAFFARILFLGQTLFFRDLYQFYLPQKALIAERLATLQLPLWNDRFHAGMPLLADISNGTLYPANILYIFFSPIRALNLDIALHAIAASLGAYALCRHLRLGKPASFAAAMVYTYSGFALSSITYLVAHQGRMFVPWMLLTWSRHQQEPGRRWWAMTAVLGTLQVFAGRPEVVAVTHLLLLLWTWTHARDHGLRQMFRWTLLPLTVVGLSAIQLLPTVALSGQSSRGAGLPFESWAWWSLAPWRLPELIVPGFFGAVDTYHVGHDYWGLGRVDGFPYFVSIYIGLLAMVLAGLGLGSKVRGQRLRWSLGFTVVIAIAFSVGRHWPFFEFVYRALPPLHLFRYPTKILELTMLPLALLVGFGLESLAGGDPRPRRRARAWFGGLAACSLLLAVLVRWWPRSGAAMDWWFLRADEVVQEGLTAIFMRTGAVTLVAALILVAGRGHRRRIASVVLSLTAVLAIDLGLAGRRVNPAAPEELFTRTPSPVAALQTLLGGNGRLFRTQDPEPPFAPPTNESLWRYARNRERLDQYLATAEGLSVAYHVDFNGLASAEMLRLARALHRQPWSHRIGPLAAADVRVVASVAPLDDPGLPPADPARAGPLYLYSNPRAPGPATFITDARLAETADLELDAVLDPRFDPRRRVVLNADEGPFVADEDTCDQRGTVQIVERNAERWSIHVESACPGFLVLQQGFDPGWQTNVDGVRVDQRHANVAFTAIAIEAGHHRVERLYRPRSVTVGLTLSLLSALGLALITFRRGQSRSVPLEPQPVEPKPPSPRALSSS